MPEQLMQLPHALLEGVEALPADARGALVVSRNGDDVGMVLAENNRVCWAMACGMERRLRELLQGYPRIAAIRQHSIESLAALAGTGDEIIRWEPRTQPFDAHGSFSPTELLAAVGARFYAKEAGGVAMPAGAIGGSFAIGDDGEPVIVQECDGERLGITTLLDLGTWAANALDATPGFTTQMIDRAIANVTTTVALGWRTSRRSFHAAIVEERSLLEGAVNALAQQHVALVVSVRAPWKLKSSV